MTTNLLLVGANKVNRDLESLWRWKPYVYHYPGFPGGSAMKNRPAMQKTQGTLVQSLGREDPVEEEMATHSSILACKIPWTEKLDGLQSMGSQWAGHNWVHTHYLYSFPTTLSPLKFIFTWRLSRNYCIFCLWNWKIKKYICVLNSWHRGPKTLVSKGARRIFCSINNS